MAKAKISVKSPTVVAFTIKKVRDGKKKNYNFGFKEFIHAGLAAIMAFSSLGILPVAALATTGGPQSGSTFSGATGIGTVVWSNPSNAQASDTSYATAVLASGGTSHYLEATGFGFSIPTNSTINGVTVKVTKKSTDSRITDNAIHLVKGGAITTGNAGSSSNTGWGTVDGISTYGSATDLWSNTLTATDINSTTFGVAISAKRTIHSGTDTASVNYISIAVDYTVNVTPATNPTLAQSCGVDVALVLDNSGSIGANLSTMKTDFNTFVGTFLPATPSYFSVSYFDTAAHYTLQTMSNNVSTITTAINAVPAATGSTNWEQGLVNAQGTFTADGKSHLVVFASDGDPNRYGATGSEGTGSGVDPNALNAAITQANTMKGLGTRIITLGLGSSVNQTNLEDVSSADAYYSAADFSGLAATLQSISTALCGGTLTVTKVIDENGSQAPAGSGWQFNVGGTNAVTDSTGKTQAVALTNGTYSVTETQQAGYAFESASCSGATDNGTQGTNSVTGIKIGTNDIVSCTFINSANAGSLTVIKHVVDGSATADQFTLNISGGSPGSVAGSETGVPVTVAAGASYGVTEASGGPDNYVASYSDDCAGTMAAGGSETCTVTNTYVAPSPTPTPTPIVTPTPTAVPTPVLIDTTFHFIKQICPSYSDITGNGTADNDDATDGNFTQFSNYSASVPHFPAVYPNKPVSPVEIPGTCAPAAGWNFQLSTDQAQTANTSTVGPTNSSGEADVQLSDLNAEEQASLTSGGQIWVSEVGQLSIAGFGALRCYQDALNGDNLDFISLGSDQTQYPTDVYCIAYNVAVPQVSPTPTPVPSVSPTPTPTCTEDCGGGTVDVADPLIVKTLDNGSPVPGATITYTLTASNDGTADATGVVATDTFPSTVTYVSDDASTSATGTTSTFDSGSDTLTWNIGTIAVGASYTMHITATVNDNATGSVANTATLTTTGGDSNTSNDTSSASGTINTDNGGGSSPTPTTTVVLGGGGGGGGPCNNCEANGGGGSGSGTGSVLGANTTIPSSGGLQAPALQGQVLGASTSLPRTGMPIGFTLLIAGALIALLDKKLKLI